jgi:hypothetical protein
MQAAWEKLLAATLVLTTSEPIKQRLISAFSSHLLHIDAADLPKDARSEFRNLIDRLRSATPLRGESAVAATVRKMSNQEVEDCARAVVELLVRVRSQSVGAITAESTSSVVPLYASLAEVAPPLVAISRA